MSLYETFKVSGIISLQKKLNKKNIHEVPQVDKIVVSMGIGSLATRKGVKDFGDLKEGLRIITGQEPKMILSKQSISNFKLREGMPVMLKVTLRAKRAYDFVERLVNLVFPRIRDFSGISFRKFDGQGNYNLGLKDYSIFPEIVPEAVKIVMGLQINICTTADTDEDALVLFKELGIIFANKDL